MSRGLCRLDGVWKGHLGGGLRRDVELRRFLGRRVRLFLFQRQPVLRDGVDLGGFHYQPDVDRLLLPDGVQHLLAWVRRRQPVLGLLLLGVVHRRKGVVRHLLRVCCRGGNSGRRMGGYWVWGSG